MLLQAAHSGADLKCKPDESMRSEFQDSDSRTHILDYAPVPGWTVHTTKEGRLYYCNHVTRTAGWLPPAEAWKSGEESLPYGWERAIDDSSRPYYINHVNKTTTYETPMVKNLEHVSVPEPRCVILERSTTLGFGFVAGSEKPVIVRFVTEGGPSVDKLLPGDQIWSVNGEDVKSAPRENVISLVRACTTSVTLVVCQPPEQQGIRKSTLLSASKRARLKTKPSRVRFAESVCVNGAPLFPPSAFSLGDICVAPMANVLKVFLENGQTKSFKYDAWTTVQDVVTSLQTKLCLTATEHFSLVVEHIKSLKRNKLTLLDPTDTLAKIASRPGAHKLRCLYRVAFVPTSAAELAQTDLAALDYLFIQCCNDVIQERFAPELHFDISLRLAALHIYQHALANNIPAAKLTVKTIEKEFGLERFVPTSLLEKMKRKEVRKLVAHFLKLYTSMAGPGKHLTILQVKLHYLDLVSQLPSYGAKCFSTGPRAETMERVILVSPKFGISQITGARNSVPVPIASLQDMKRIEVRTEDELNRTVLIKLQNDQLISVSLEERDACELILVLKGYFRLISNHTLCVDKDESPSVEDLAPPYLSQHKVIPEKWSYVSQQQIKTACFALQPTYQNINKKTNGLYNTMGRQSKPPLMVGLSLDSNMNSSISNRNHQYKMEFNSFDYSNTSDLQSVMSMEILESGLTEFKNDEVLQRVKEMQQLVENSEKYLTDHEHLEQLKSAAEWQETAVDIESDSDSIYADDTLGILKHSDSLLLLNKGCNLSLESKHSFTNAAVDILRSELNQSESDNDSMYTPHNSPKHNSINFGNFSENTRVSFGLHSPDNPSSEAQDLKSYLKQLKDFKNLTELRTEIDNISDLYVFDPDLIDLTLLPPPATPDELDCAVSSPINAPPSSFADSVEKLNLLSILHEKLDLETFLASVTVLPPTQKNTPAIELTPEEIMSYIIPPPPNIQISAENVSIKSQDTSENALSDVNTISSVLSQCNDNKRRNSNTSIKSNIIEYSTIDRKGAFLCCTKKKDKSSEIIEDDYIQPPQRRCSDEKPPERPPKSVHQERQRSHSLISSSSHIDLEFPPKLPPKGETNHQAPPRLYLPPKKPPLPPVPPLDVLRSRKNISPQLKASTEIRTAGIGSPYLQRNKNMYSDLDSQVCISNPNGLHTSQSTAISTPTTPHIGKDVQLSAVSIDIPGITDPYNNESPSPSRQATCSTHNRSYSESSYLDKTLPKNLICKEHFECLQTNKGCNSSTRNGCISIRENLLIRTDEAMANLLIKLDQVAGHCNTAHIHGGGKLICEEMFQIAKNELTTQSLQLVQSSKMLVIAMSDPSLPDLPHNMAVCLTILKKITELCQDIANHTTAPLQTRNLILKVHGVISAFRHLITSNVDRTSPQTIEDHLTGEAESLANVLTTLLRSLRVFSP